MSLPHQEGRVTKRIRVECGEGEKGGGSQEPFPSLLLGPGSQQRGLQLRWVEWKGNRCAQTRKLCSHAHTAATG